MYQIELNQKLEELIIEYEKEHPMPHIDKFPNTEEFTKVFKKWSHDKQKIYDKFRAERIKR